MRRCAQGGRGSPSHEPPSVLWMSSAALVWSGITTMAVAVVVDQVASQ